MKGLSPPCKNNCRHYTDEKGQLSSSEKGNRSKLSCDGHKNRLFFTPTWYKIKSGRIFCQVSHQSMPIGGSTCCQRVLSPLGLEWPEFGRENLISDSRYEEVFKTCRPKGGFFIWLEAIKGVGHGTRIRHSF